MGKKLVDADKFFISNLVLALNGNSPEFENDNSSS